MSYQPLTPKAIKELAAPQTWPAGTLPVILAGALSYTLYQTFSLLSFIILLLLSILLQSAVNTLNDYFDYIKGTDREDNFFDEKDASIIYNHINPKAALKTGLLFLGLALLGGLYLVYQTGWPLLLIGSLGALAVYFYSGGPYPISYLPIGEAVSGLMMGGLLTIASVYAISGSLSLWNFYYCLPLAISIGLILMTNNTCDIERDTQSGRHTLPIILGRKVSGKLLFFGFLFAILIIAHISYYSFRSGFWIVLLLLAHGLIYLIRIRHMQYSALNRRNAMKTSLLLTTLINSYYIIIIFWEGTFSG